jgi:twitching motility protein PilT
VFAALSACDLLRGLDAQLVAQVQDRVRALSLDDGEALVAEGAPSDAFFLVLEGALEVSARARVVATLGAGTTAGEMGLLLEEPRTAGMVARGPTTVLRFDCADFKRMMDRVPGFGMAVSRALAQRLRSANQQMPLPPWDGDVTRPDPDVASMLPASFLQRHRILPLAVEGNVLVVGCSADPGADVLAAIQAQHPSLEVRPVRVAAQALEAGLRACASPTDAPRAASAAGDVLSLEPLLRRMVAEGASDLHLSAGHPPWWRRGGDLQPVPDAPPLGHASVLELLRPVMDPRSRDAFEAEHDADFAHAVEGLARFRVNLFRDHRGVSAVLRQIPSKILTFEQLGLPPALARFCEAPKGLVLVTGPTGSGKSTTLAAMIDVINRSRPAHILTMEDPIEFVHASQRALVNQREIGTHTRSFSRALKAALREDPDVVLVGELRDRETVQLALETANTGHLVFATLHTNTAASTIDRIVDLFPADQHGAVRSSLAETLRGVVCQTLCRRMGGGRVAALEVLVGTPAVANLVRDGKTFQIPSLMQTGRGLGMQLLNDELARLVQERRIDADEALSRAVDKAELGRRLGRA